MRVLLAGGGTAGHINPALSIASFIRQRHPEAEIAFAGTNYGLEKTLVPKAGYPLFEIQVEGLRRSLSPKNIRALYLAVTSLKKAKKILNEYKPDIVIGTGGYVSFPILYMAAKQRIPTAIHEQNAYPGITSKLLSTRVDRVMTSFLSSRDYFPKSAKLTLVGNPIDEKVVYADREQARKELKIPDGTPYIVSTGGSLGARELNKAVADFIALHEPEGRFKHTHATGKYGWRWMPGLLKQKGVNIETSGTVDVREYIYDREKVYAAADLFIGRAGAITLGEIMVLGLPAILIPSPNVTHNHQFYNAMSLVKEGAAVLLEEKHLTGRALYDKVNELLASPEKRKSLSENAKRLAIYDSTQKIYDVVAELLKVDR